MGEPSLNSFTASDGYEWHYRRFASVGPPLAEMVGLHGIQSHGGWYEQSCKQLAAAGFAVSFLDRRGSGLNSRDRGDASSFRRLLDDIAEYLVTRPSPRFVMGISWGGKLAIALQRRHPQLVDGMVLIAPGLIPRVGPTILEKASILVARILRSRKLFSIPLNDPELFTLSPEQQAFIRDDPLALRHATSRLLIESRRLDTYLQMSKLFPKRKSAPVLLLLAEHDRIIDTEATRLAVTHFAAENCSTIVYRHAHHTLEFEPGGPPFVDDVIRWLRERVATDQ